MHTKTRWIIALVAWAFTAPLLEARPITVQGRVTADGAAINDAQVTLLAIEPSVEEGLRLLAAEPPPVAATGRSDPEGYFEITAPKAGMWRLVVAAPGRLPMEHEILPLLSDRQLPTVELPTDEGLTVRVMSADKPVVDAWVWVADQPAQVIPSPEKTPGWRAAIRRGRVAGEGVAVLPRAPGEKIVVKGIAPGFLMASRSGKRSAILELEVGKRHTVEVRMGTRLSPGTLLRLGEASWPIAVTDKDGRAEIVVRPDRRVRIVCEAAHHPRVNMMIGPVGESTDPTDLILPGAVRRRGKVVDSVTGAPIAGALVWPFGRPTHFTRSDASGSYLLRGLHMSESTFQTAASDYFPEIRQTKPVSHTDAEVPAIALKPAARVRGRIVDDDAAPVSHAEVRARHVRGPRRSGVQGEDGVAAYALSAADGIFQLSDLLPKGVYELTLERDGFAPATRTTFALVHGPNELETQIVLTRGLTVTGVVVDGDGEAVTAAGVTLVSGKPATRGGELRVFEALSDLQGRFEFFHVASGTFDLTVRRAGFARKIVPGLELEGPRRVELRDVVLEPGVVLDGRVLAADGGPIAGAAVRIAHGVVPAWYADDAAEMPPPDTVSADDGRFVLEDMAPRERVTLEVRHNGYTPAVLGSIEAPTQEPLVIVLRASASLSGRVVDENGEALEKVGVRVFEERPGQRRRSLAQTLTRKNGRFTLSEIAPGALGLVASGVGFQQTEIHGIELELGEDMEDVRVTLRRGGILVGTVRLPDGGAAAGAVVALLQTGRSGAYLPTYTGTRTDGDGRYRLAGVPPGQQVIGAEREGYLRAIRYVDVTAGEMKLDLELDSGFEVSGRVVDAAGATIAGVDLALVSSGHYGISTTSGPDGSFRFAGVQDGSYQVRATRAGYAPATEPVRVAGGPMLDLKIELPGGIRLVGRLLGLAAEHLPQVEVMAARRGIARAGEVSYDGRYRVRDVGVGEWIVRARVANRGYMAQATVTIHPGDLEVTVDLEFGAGLRLSGRATHAGRPMAGASVQVLGLDVVASGSTLTDGEGGFQIDGLFAGRYRLRLSDARTNLEYSEDLDLESDDDVTIKIATARLGGLIHGGADHRPLADVRVALEPATEAATARWAGPAGPRRTRSDSQGAFHIHQVPAGSWRLTAQADGHRPATETLELEPGEVRTDLAMTLEPVDGAHLQIVLPTGGWPASVHVVALDSAGQVSSSGTYPTAQEGEVHLSTVPPGIWTLLVTSDGMATETLRVDVPGPPVPVHLQAGGGLRLVVPGLAGSQRIVRLRLIDSRRRPLMKVSRGGALEVEWPVVLGTAFIDGIRPGDWTIRVESSDGRVWSSSVNITAGFPTHFELKD